MKEKQNFNVLINYYQYLSIISYEKYLFNSFNCSFELFESCNRNHLLSVSTFGCDKTKRKIR